MKKQFDFSHFVEAQNTCYTEVVKELSEGRKCSHWLWFIFPQIKGLGASAMAQKYALSSLAEAKAYADDELLGKRLQECIQLMLAADGNNAEAVLGALDSLKFRSSMTLFKQADVNCSLYQQALDKFYGGEEDQLTLALLPQAV